MTKNNQKKWKRLFGVATIFTSLLLFSGLCQYTASAHTDKTAEANGKSILIGMSSALTGPYSEYGQAQRKAAQLAIDQWNKKGGVAGRQVKFITYDDQLIASRSTLNVQKLLYDDKVDAIILPAGSTCALAVLPMVVKSGLPAVNLIATSLRIVYPNGEGKNPNPNVFTFSTQSNIEPAVLAKYVSEEWKKVGILTESTEYGKGMGEYIQKDIARIGKATVVGWEEYDQGTPDVTPQLGKLKNEGAQVIALVALGADTAAVRKSLARMGWNAPIVGTKGIFGQPYKEIAGKLVVGTKGVMISTWLDPSRFTKEQKELANEWKAAYGHDRYYGKGKWPIPEFATVSAYYDGVKLLLEAMNRAGSTDPKKVINAFDHIKNYPGAIGFNYTFSPEVHNAITVDKLEIAEYEKVGNRIEVEPLKR